MLDTSTIHTFDFAHPADNLRPPGTRRRKPEAEFTALFASVYRDRFLSVHTGTKRRKTLFVRELPVHGNGIADLVVLNWGRSLALEENPTVGLTRSRLTVRAFEIKMSNWRRGLMQAHRYRYFSNAAILVVPKDKLKSTRAHLDLFQTLRVGLWGFDPDSTRITTVYTPRPANHGIARNGTRAVAAALQAASR